MTKSSKSHIDAANSAILINGELELVGSYFAPDYVVHLTDQDMRGGHATVLAIAGLFRGAFPNLSAEINVLMESNDMVAWQRTMRAKHTGAYKGFPATGQEVVWRDLVVSRLVGGLIAEEWVVTDLAERLLLARKTTSRSPVAKRKSRSPRREGDA